MKKFCKNLMGHSFTIITGTGKPNINIDGNPKIWVEEELVAKHPYWFEEVIEEEVIEEVVLDEPELIDVESIMEACEDLSRKDLDALAETFGVKLDRRKKLKTMRKNFKSELEEMNK